MKHDWPVVPGVGLPIHTIFGIGRNYGEHARELGNAVPEEPIVFLKPLSSVLCTGGEFFLPKFTERVDFEGELVLALARGGRDVPESEALDLVGAIGVGVDFTARDLQDKAKKTGTPWALAKGLDGAAALSDFTPVEVVQRPIHELHFSLSVNGTKRQVGFAGDMIFSCAKLIAFLSSRMTLFPGDLIYTGTPKGVGPIERGDRILMTLENQPVLDIRVS